MDAHAEPTMVETPTLSVSSPQPGVGAKTAATEVKSSGAEEPAAMKVAPCVMHARTHARTPEMRPLLSCANVRQKIR
jgi:hypothetical protein|eukprot:COSAG02_NODE_26696_length_627_cov_0.676136_1_plen_77_part_00